MQLFKVVVMQDGRPKWLLNMPRSASAFGSSYASTMAIVLPVPTVSLVEKLYADLIVDGDRPVGAEETPGLTRSGWLA